jgi:hypothetical protein
MRLSIIKKNTQEKIHRLHTWHGKLIVALAFLIITGLSLPLIRLGITSYLYRVDELRPSSRIIVENWDGNIEMFEKTRAVARSAGATEIWSIIFEDEYLDTHTRNEYMLHASAAGIDTNVFFLIPVFKQEPKTLHIARAVADTAHLHGWQHITIVTEDLHSARSRQAYILAASRYGMSVSVIGISVEGVSSTNWYSTSTGLFAAFSETIKKLYYDFFVF